MTTDSRRRLGRRGEYLAALYLRLRGYQILARDLRTPAAQVDLLARRGKALVLCEVKSRRGPIEITLRLAQQRRLARAARWVLDEWAEPDTMLRVDLITVEFIYPLAFPRIRHYPDCLGEEVA